MGQLYWDLYLAVTFFALVAAHTDIIKCSNELPATKGYTYPADDIFIEYGNPLEIICVVNDAEYLSDESNPSQYLYFTVKNKNVTDNVEILNATSIRLYDAHISKSSSTYICQVGSEVVCLNRVTVGTKPLPVEDFGCISTYENLTCSWTPPNNYIHTEYNLQYSLNGRPGRPPYGCPGNKVEKKDNKMSCVWTNDSEPHFRQWHPWFTFKLTMTNMFGNRSLSYLFDNTNIALNLRKMYL